MEERSEEVPYVDMRKIRVGGQYTRDELAQAWGYESYHALARGVVTPANDNKIILFVTEVKKSDREPYADRLVGRVLEWEGPIDHFAEERMVKAHSIGDEIHVFYRYWPNDPFTYIGRADVISYLRRATGPSRFKLEVEWAL